jgi:Uri superfamily endonuclease
MTSGPFKIWYLCTWHLCAAVQVFGALSGSRGKTRTGIFFNSGYWIYVGSAFGPGGLRSRLSHHLKPSHRPHWHLDYIKNARCSRLKSGPPPIRSNASMIGSAIFSALNGATRPIAGFGASDCTCRSHLIHLPNGRAFPVSPFSSVRLCRHMVHCSNSIQTKAPFIVDMNGNRASIPCRWRYG